MALAYGLGVPLDGAPAALAGVGPAFGRLERITAGDRQIVLGLRQEPDLVQRHLRALASEELPRHLLIAVSNTLVDGEDFGWLWDVDFEAMVPRLRGGDRVRACAPTSWPTG